MANRQIHVEGHGVKIPPARWLRRSVMFTSDSASTFETACTIPGRSLPYTEMTICVPLAGATVPWTLRVSTIRSKRTPDSPSAACSRSSGRSEGASTSSIMANSSRGRLGRNGQRTGPGHPGHRTRVSSGLGGRQPPSAAAACNAAVLGTLHHQGRNVRTREQA